jgi:hypothetical protein
MADANQQAQELAQTMAKLNEEMALYGRTTVQSEQARTDANMKAKYGINNFSAGTAQAAKALEGLGGAAIAGMKAMAEGRKGAAAFNGAMDELATSAMAAGAALALLAPGGIIIKAFIAATTAATVGLIKYNQMTLDMVDKLHKGYQGMSKSGAAASDGMTGLFNDAKKLGLSMGELDGFVSLVAEHSQDFALFAGSVSEGRKQIADMGGALKSSRTEFFNMGMTTQDVNAGMASFLRLQGRTGQAQKMTTDQLAAGAKAYMLEMDGLAKLTGQNKKDLEDQRMKMLNHSKAAATLRLMERNGNEKGAKALQSFTNMMGLAGPGVQEGIMAMLNGSLSDPEAQKLFRGSAGEARVVIDMIKNQQISAVEGAQRLGKALGTVSEGMLENASINSAYGDSFTAVAEAQRGRVFSENDLVKQEQKMLADRAKQIAGADAVVAAQTQLYNTQIAANETLERMMLSNAASAQAFANKLADASNEAATQLQKLANIVEKLVGKLITSFEKKGENEKTGVLAGTAVGGILGNLGGGALGTYIGGALGTAVAGPAGTVIGAALGRTVGQYLGTLLGGAGGYGTGGAVGSMMDSSDRRGVDRRAAGGPVSKSTPYLVGEQGPEIFVPKAAGDIVPNDRLGAGSAIGGNFSAAIDEMFKDVKKQEKILDVDTIRQKQFSDLQKRYFDTYGGFMKDVIEQVEDNDPTDTTSTIGRMFSGMMGMFGGGGGSGLQMPRASNIMGMGGGQGLQKTSQTDLAKMGLNIKTGDVQAGGAGISPKLIEMAKAIQGGVPGFGYFSAFNDKFHQEKAPSSKHTQGLAADFTTIREPSVEDGKQITNWLKSMGASVAIDEYRNPSANAVGKGHFHVEIPAFEYGGDIPAGQLGIAGENGKPEIITGPASVTSNNDIMGAFNAMNGLLAQSVGRLDDLLRAQKDNNDISSKMLRMQT